MPADTDVERIPGLLGDAKIFFDAGKLDHAEGLCEEVLKIDSENSEALRLIAAIWTARRTKLAENVVAGSGARPAEMERVLPPEAGASRDHFIAPQTIGSFEHAISNALNFSTEERRRQGRFTEPGGVSNVVYNSKGRQRIYRLLETRLPSVMYDNVGLGEVLRRLSDEVRQRDPEKKGVDLLLSETPRPPIDPATGLPVGHMEPFVELNSLNIKIVPPLQNIALGVALDAICKVAERRVYYSVEESGVVFLSTDRPRPLYTRTYKIDRDAVLGHFGRQWIPDPATLIPPPKESEVLRQFMDTLREFLAEAGVDLAPPEAIFFSDALGKLMVRATLEDLDVIERSLHKFAAPVRQVLLDVKVAEFRGEAVGIRNILGTDVTRNTVVNGPQYRLVIGALEQTAGVEVLGALKVTTLDGRSARFDLKRPKTRGSTDTILHVAPHIGGDGRNFHLTIDLEMLGEREAAVAKVRDRQTAVVPLPAMKKFHGEALSDRDGTRIAFVTATIIDAAGNPIHPEEDEVDPFEGIRTLPKWK